jgi:UPF0755 protein
MNNLAKGILIFTVSCFLLASMFIAVFLMLQTVEKKFGQANDFLSDQQRLSLSLRLFFDQKALNEEREISGTDNIFAIGYGESLTSVADRLYQLGYIGDKSAFLHYLQYKGLDQSVQAGDYEIPQTISDIRLAAFLQDATPTEAIVSVLAGWRLEELAESFPNTGLTLDPNEFILLAQNPREGQIPFGIQASTMEGFFYPGRYRVARDSTAEELLQILTQQFEINISGEIKRNIEKNGLTLYEGVILASIIEREAVNDEEMPRIASVFYNRLAQGMKLETDPTIQYAVGRQVAGGTWWKVPLTNADFDFISMYNTYQIEGLPATPICNPSLAALEAVANPEETNYFYFMARCDGSGWHNFSVTYEQHLQNLCN